MDHRLCSKELVLACALLSNATVGALIRNVGRSESMIRLSFNMAAASHTWFRPGVLTYLRKFTFLCHNCISLNNL